MKPFSVPGLLRAAASYIEIHGHEQREGRFGGTDYASGPCCPLVAMRRLTQQRCSSAHVEVSARRSLRTRVPGSRVSFWSDRTPTAEVLATMRRVAKDLDGQTP